MTSPAARSVRPPPLPSLAKPPKPPALALVPALSDDDETEVTQIDSKPTVLVDVEPPTPKRSDIRTLMGRPALPPRPAPRQAPISEERSDVTPIVPPPEPTPVIEAAPATPVVAAAEPLPDTEPEPALQPLARSKARAAVMWVRTLAFFVAFAAVSCGKWWFSAVRVLAMRAQAQLRAEWNRARARARV